MLEECLSAALNHFLINGLQISGLRPRPEKLRIPIVFGIVVYPRNYLRAVRLHRPPRSASLTLKGPALPLPGLSLDLVHANVHGRPTAENTLRDRCDY